MVTTVPAVGRASGTGRWASAAIAYLLASALAAALFGAALGLLGLAVPIAGQQTREILWAALLLLLGLVELGFIPLPRPQRGTQVPARWRSQFPPEVSSALYGATLGVGVLTRIPFVPFYAVIGWILLDGNPLRGAVAFAVFGLARAGPVALGSPFLRNHDESYRLVRSLMPLRDAVGRAAGMLLIVLALVDVTRIGT